MRAQGDDVDVAEVLMLVARAALLAGDVDRAVDAAGEAETLFEAQGRAGWWAAAASLRVEAHQRAGAADESDAAVIDTVIAATEDAGLTAASDYARVLAAELAADARRRGRPPNATLPRPGTGSGPPPAVAATSSRPSSWPAPDVRRTLCGVAPPRLTSSPR